MFHTLWTCVRWSSHAHLMHTHEHSLYLPCHGPYTDSQDHTHASCSHIPVRAVFFKPHCESRALWQCLEIAGMLYHWALHVCVLGTCWNRTTNLAKTGELFSLACLRVLWLIVWIQNSQSHHGNQWSRSSGSTINHLLVYLNRYDTWHARVMVLCLHEFVNFLNCFNLFYSYIKPSADY